MAKIVDAIRTYCPKCNKHTLQKVKLYKKGKQSPFSVGQARYDRKLTGYVGKVKGKKSVRKIGKHQKIILECPTCKKKQERIIGTRTKKVLEVVKKGAMMSKSEKKESKRSTS
jgi:large subunit ribosomal protein L44e